MAIDWLQIERPATVHENSVPSSVFAATSFSGDVHCGVRNRRRHPGVDVSRPEPVGLLTAQKRRAFAENRRNLNPRAQILWTLECIKTADAQEVNVAASPQSVESCCLVLRVSVEERLTRIAGNRVGDDDRLVSWIFILERDRSTNESQLTERWANPENAADVAV